MATNKTLRIGEKHRAILILLEHGHRGDEWQEAGLLHAVEKVLTQGDVDLSNSGLNKLIDEAKQW